MRSAQTQHANVFGLCWGDEGKGKVVDLLCPVFDIVTRYNGGANAGHTVCVGQETFALHLLPSGVLHPHVTGVIGPGVVVDPSTLLAEADALAERGIDLAGRVKLSDRAHLVLAYHKLEDQLGEHAADAESRIGTTARGIGPCYADKMRRSTAVRVSDLMYDPSWEARVSQLVSERRDWLKTLFGTDGGLDPHGVLEDLRVAKERLEPWVCDSTEYLHRALSSGRRLLFEGANGMLLDVDHGTYPYVTSSSTGPHGIGAGAGVPSSQVDLLIGTTKAYATRVGGGPFVSELRDEVGNRIRERGHEFGTTTGRPRRCGWFDGVSCRYSARLSGVTDLALMHLDTLSGFDRVGLCTGYRLDGRTIQTLPADARALDQAEPVIEYHSGWLEDVRAVRRYEDLPGTARAYIERIEVLVGAPVSIIGLGPERSQILVRGRVAELVGGRQAATVPRT